MRRKCSAWSRISLGRQVAAELHRARSRRTCRSAGSPTARRRRPSGGRRGSASARPRRPAVVRVEQRLDRAVGRVRLVRERRASRTAPSSASRARSAAGQVGHLLVAARAARRPAPHLAGAEGGLAGVGERVVEERRGPRVTIVADMRLGQVPRPRRRRLAPRRRGRSSSRAASRSAARSCATRRATSTAARASRVDGKPARALEAATARVYAVNKPAGRRLDRRGHRTAARRSSTWSRAGGGCTPSGASTSAPPA